MTSSIPRYECLLTKAVIAKHTAEMKPMPLARPSTPSIMLKAFMKATIQKTVTRHPSQLGKCAPKQEFMRKPSHQARSAASIWKMNFVRAERPKRSSTSPNGWSMTSGTSNLCISAGASPQPLQRRPKNAVDTPVNASSMPRPPPRGTARVWMCRLKSGLSIIPHLGRSQSIRRVRTIDNAMVAQASVAMPISVEAGVSNKMPSM